ncbi:MAG: hypothetical protein N2749_07005 [Clostridia bacterium]|nr:hypothetical protein [Clostridia bacterium]
MVNYIAYGLIIFSVVGISGLLIYYSILKNKYKKNKNLYVQEALVVKNKSNVNDTLDRFYQLVYLVFIKMPVIKYYTKKTRLKMEMANDYTEYQIRKQSGKTMFMVVIFVFLALTILLNLVTDAYMSLMIIIGVLIVAEKIIDFRVNRVADKILRQIPEAFTNIRHAFHEHGMIEESFTAAIDELGEKDIVPQLKRIKEALLADKPETDLERYYDTAPNRFLKLFAGVSYLTMELGDRKVDGTSVYLKNLNNILSDVYLEVLKKDKLNYMFRSLTIIAVVPLICINPLQAWAETNFPSLSNFYNSSIGFVIQSLILVMIFVSYLMLRIIKEDSEEVKYDRVISVRWQDKLYKSDFVKMLIDAFKPKTHTKKYHKTVKLIKNTNAYLTMEWFYINKFVAAIIAFIFAVILIFNMQRIDVTAIYNKIGDEFLSFGKLSPEQEGAAKALNERDNTYLEKYKNKAVTKEELANSLTDPATGQADTVAVDRIYDKIIKLQSSYFKFWHLLIALIISYIAYCMPTLVLIIRNKLREMEKENEIMQFQSIILMLMYIERVDVQTILEWLERFSYAFKEPIATALNNYESGATEALEELKENVPNKQFLRIVEQLESAVERIPIRAAFDELETERTYFYERRKEGNERLVQKKVSYGKALGFAPLVILIGGYLVAPLMMVSIMQMVSYFSKMTF